MLQITPSLAIPENELTFTFVHSSGPGGQNVNKVATAVQLRFDVQNSPSLPNEVKTALIRLAGRRIASGGVLVIEAKRHRGQEQNRLEAQGRLVTLIQKALVRPKRRRPTKSTLASQVKRIESKKRRGATKHIRQSLPDREE